MFAHLTGAWLRKAGLSLALLASGVLLPRAGPADAASYATSNDHDVTVMTQNLYPGFNEVALFSAADEVELVLAAADAWQAVHDTDFPARADRIAAEIAAAAPDLVGLQEAFRYKAFYADGKKETIDFLKILRDQLQAHGAHYRVAAETTDIDIVLPIDFYGSVVEATDRTAFLVRTDLPAYLLRLAHTASGNYSAHISVPVAGGAAEILIQRGWVAADVEAGGRFFRFVNTHLEDIVPEVQAAQAEELLSGPADGGGLPVILVGDFNSDATTAGAGYTAYVDIVSGGFADAWLDLSSDPGYTCCQAPDLLQPYDLTFRPDAIFHKDGPTTQDIFLVGDQNSDRIPPPDGLWPSDHAGVVGTLTLPEE